MGPDLGGRFGTFVFCVFFVEYTLDCRDKYKYLKPLWAKWSRYYFTSLGGALTGGHRSPKGFLQGAGRWAVVGPVVWLWLWGLLRCTLKVLDFQSGFTSGRVARTRTAICPF